MPIVSAIDPLYTLTGFVIGFIVGLTGVGGGSLMTPVLIIVFGVHPATAVGTDLLFAAVTKSFGTLVNGFNKAVDWRVVGRLATGSVPASALTIAVLALHGPQNAATGHLVATLLGAMLLVTALTLVFRPQILALAGRHSGLSASRQRTFTILTGVVLGVLVSVSSVGAGAIGVAALMLVYPRLPIAKVIGSDIAHAVPLTLVAGAGHLVIGDVGGQMLASLLVGSIPGVVLASVLAPRFSETVLRYLLAGVLVVAGFKLIAV